MSLHIGCVWFNITELPVMTRMPELDTRNATSICIRWRDWSNPPDSGTGPVVGYIAYYQVFGDVQWTEAVRTTSKIAVISHLLVEQKYNFRVAAIHQSASIGIPSPINMFATCGSMWKFILFGNYFVSFNSSINVMASKCRKCDMTITRRYWCTDRASSTGTSLVLPYQKIGHVLPSSCNFNTLQPSGDL